MLCVRYCDELPGTITFDFIGLCCIAFVIKTLVHEQICPNSSYIGSLDMVHFLWRYYFNRIWKVHKSWTIMDPFPYFVQNHELCCRRNISAHLNTFKSAIKVCKKGSCNRGCGKSPTCETNCGKCHCKCCDCCDNCCCASPCCRSQSCGERVCAICCQALCGCIAKFFSILFCYFLCSDD